MPLRLSDHARVRLQQRGIARPVLDCLLAYGRKEHDHHGAEIVFFDHHARERLRRDLGDATLRDLGHGLDAYAVVDARRQMVLTVGHRYRRINRN